MKFHRHGRELSVRKHKGAKFGVIICAGDSYIIDPGGGIVARGRRHHEDFIFAGVDLSRGPDQAFGLSKSARSHREFKPFLDAAIEDGAGPK